MNEYTSSLKKAIKNLFKAGAGSGVDVLYPVTALALLLFSIVYFGRGFVAEPLRCFTQTNMIEGWSKALSDVCHDDGLLYLHPSEGYHPPPSIEVMKKREVTVHRYVVWIALAQALLFLTPSMTWKVLSKQSATTWGNLIDRAVKLMTDEAEAEQRARQGRKPTDESESERVLRKEELTGDISDVLQVSAGRRQPIKYLHMNVSGSNRFNSRMTALGYFCVKILQILIVLGQLKCLNQLLRNDQMNYLSWVPNEITRGWYLGEPNPPSMTLFGVSTKCMTETHARPGHIGRLERHHLGCRLLVHRWIGLFYMVFYVWSLLLLLATAIDALVVMSKVALRPLRVRYVKKLLAGEGYEGIPSCIAGDFVEKGLGWDGVLLLRLIEANANGMWAKILTRGLYDNFSPWAGGGGRGPVEFID